VRPAVSGRGIGKLVNNGTFRVRLRRLQTAAACHGIVLNGMQRRKEVAGRIRR
jgi:hypothetical protein